MKEVETKKCPVCYEYSLEQDYERSIELMKIIKEVLCIRDWCQKWVI